MDPVTVTFHDTFSGEIINHPVRGIYCQHYQCFDLRNYIELMFFSRAREWKCPYCKKDARKLIIDKYQLSLISELKKSDLFPKKLMFFRNGKIDYQYLEAAEL